MEVYQTEEQQVEAIKKFWQNNKNIIFATIILFAIGYFSVKYYQHHREVIAENASFKHTKMLGAFNDKDFDSAERLANDIMSNYKNTPYSGLAALKLAKNYMDNDEHDKAKQKLVWIVDNKSKGPVYHIAITRLARIYRSSGDLDKALELLDKNPNGFKALFDEIRGDIYLDKKDYANARKFYQQALDSAPKTGATPWLQLKLEDISGLDS